MQRTKNEVLRTTTLNYLSTLNVSNPPSPTQIEQELLHLIRNEFEIENSQKDKSQKWAIPQQLSFAQIADIIAFLYPVCKLACAGESADSDYDLLAIYQTKGFDEGIYLTSEDTFRQIARQYNYSLTAKDFGELMLALKDKVPRKVRCDAPNLVPVNNGIFDFETKTLLPFSPDKIFISKSRVNYNPNASNPVIQEPDGNMWDIESWLASLSDDPEIVNLLWEILGAIIRPGVRWNKSAWLYSESGNNGKGTLCELMRSLCGTGSYASIAISDFSKDFYLEPLTRASAIIVDENDVGSFIDKAANLKAVITNDVIQINRKHKSVVACQFKGFMVQCLNEFPKIRDKSDSFYRRQIFIPMTKCFTGMEKRYIKNDYLHRQEVLEYVLKRVLHMDYYELSEPQACKNVLGEYKEYNDPVRQFFEDFQDRFVWDLLPFTFLYSLYKEWHKQNNPSGGIQGRNTFINDIVNVVKNHDDWYCLDKTQKIKSTGKINDPEPLIYEYSLSDWYNNTYRGQDIDRICTPNLATGYRGILRQGVSA